MDKKVYENILSYLKDTIAGSKFENHVFSVGGCERDKRLCREIKDIDLVVDLPHGGIDFANWLSSKELTKGSVVVYENFGTAMFRLKEYPEEEIEVVQTRKECYHDAESRNPETSYGTIMIGGRENPPFQWWDESPHYSKCKYTQGCERSD